jgi:hypothetical protein
MPGDGPDERADASEILVPLVSAATVRIHSAQDGGRLLGSGFFIAPNWVLTCAHVALEGARTIPAARASAAVEQLAAPAPATAPAPAGPVPSAARPPAPAARLAAAGAGGHRVSIGYGEKLLSGVVEWSEPAEPVPGGSWPAPDLALIRLIDVVDHPCVWLTERTAKGYTTNQVAFFGWVPLDGENVSYTGRCTISGQLVAGSGGVLRLGNEDEMPHGLSGGPVVDLVRGEVIGVVKARRKGHDGGLAVGIQQLRRLPSGPGPEGDLYERVMTAHDLYHADQHDSVHGRDTTWTDAHSEIGAAAGRALTPGQRTRLLGLLAQLPPPVGARGVQDIVTEVRGGPVQGLPVAPRTWRDGLGLLYDLRRGTAELESVLRYAVQAATAPRTAAADETVERQLAQWAQELAAADVRLTRLFRTTLLTERRSRLRARETAVPALPPHLSITPVRPEALLEIIPRGWEPGRYDWRVCVVPPGGEVDCVAEDFRGTAFAELPVRLAEPLAEAFRRCDEPGWAASLQLAVPGALVGFAADAWRLVPGGGLLGADRPIVVRRTDPPADEDPALSEERHTRWRALHRSAPAPVVLDCDESTPSPVSDESDLRLRPPETLPVLCRSGSDAPEVLHALVRSGYAIALWRRDPVDRDALCADFHRGTARAVRAARTAAGLPGELLALRAKVAAGMPETFWSNGLTLLYDDPTRPLPGTDELLETP